MRILVVEDDREMAKYLKRGLEGGGYTVDIALDGAEGLRLACSDGYDAVILDLMLPKKDGLAVVSEMRSRGFGTPVLMLTARDGVDDRVRGLDAGADDYLPKPFSLEELQARLRALLRRGAAGAETELRAPFAGTVAALNTKVGEQVAAGAPIVRLADFSTWHIETEDLTEIDIVAVREGSRATVVFDAIPDLELPATVMRIRPIGENKQGDITYTAILALEQQDPRLRWNMTASVTIISD